MMKSLVILISGRGSNMQALLRANLPIKNIVVISNNPDAAGLVTAKKQGRQTIVVDHRNYPNQQTFDAELAKQIDYHQPDLIALAGFMRILSNSFVTRYQGQLINIHPSLLPAFTGLDTHARALARGVKIHGCTVHFVTSQVDCGPIVIQAAVPILPNDTQQTLAARILQQEHQIYPQAIRWFIENKLDFSGDHVCVSGAIINEIAIHSPGV